MSFRNSRHGVHSMLLAVTLRATGTTMFAGRTVVGLVTAGLVDVECLIALTVKANHVASWGHGKRASRTATESTALGVDRAAIAVAAGCCLVLRLPDSLVQKRSLTHG